MRHRGKAILVLVLGVCLLGAMGWVIKTKITERAEKSAIRKALADRDLRLAKTLLTKYVHDHDSDAESHLLLAQTSRRLDDYQTADRHLNFFRARNGNSEEVELERILQRAQSGDLRGADGVIKIYFEQPEHPSATRIIEALVRGYLANRRADIAIVMTDVWLKRDPAPGDRAYALYLRGLAYKLLSRISDSIAHYREALSLTPRLHECTLALAALLSREAPLEGLPLYDRLREAGYKPTEVSLGTVRCLRHLAELDRAAGLIAPLEVEQPANIDVLVEAAKIDLDRSRPSEAEPRLKRAVQLMPKHRDANVQLARCLRDLGRDPEARAQLEIVRRIDEELSRQAPPDGKSP